MAASSTKANQNKGPKYTTQDKMQQEDEAIISTSNNISTPRQHAAGGGNGKVNSNRDRALVKTSLVADANIDNINTTLEDDSTLAGRSGRPYDQFQGKSTTYNDDIYSTKIDMTKVSKEQQRKAMQIESEIQGAATSNRHVAEERNQVQQQSEDTIVDKENEDEEAKYGATDRRNKV